MKNVKLKIMGIAMATMMIFGNTPVLASHCTQDNAERTPEEYATEVVAGQTVDVSLSVEDNDLDLYKFVAPVSGVYTIEITNYVPAEDYDSYDVLFVVNDEYCDWLGDNYDLEEENYASSMTIDLIEGETYYLWAWTLDYFQGMDYSFTVIAPDSLSGWQDIGGQWKYYSDGVAVTGWKQLNNRWYFFNADGIMQTGWLKSPGNGKWYYLHPTDGYMMSSCWISSSNMWYYIGSDGLMVTGWQKIGNSWYYFNPIGGAMMKGWQKIGNNWYYLNPNGGAMVTGWQQISGSWYYMNSSGAMVTGWQKIGNTWYYFYSSGKMATGEVHIGSSIYYFMSDGSWIAG